MSQLVTLLLNFIQLTNMASKLIELWIEISDDNELKSVSFTTNETDFASDKKLLKNIANAILTSIEMDEGFEELTKGLNETTDPEH